MVTGGLRPGGLRPGGLRPGGLRPWGNEPTWLRPRWIEPTFEMDVETNFWMTMSRYETTLNFLIFLSLCPFWSSKETVFMHCMLYAHEQRCHHPHKTCSFVQIFAWTAPSREIRSDFRKDTKRENTGFFLFSVLTESQSSQTRTEACYFNNIITLTKMFLFHF